MASEPGQSPLVSGGVLGAGARRVPALGPHFDSRAVRTLTVRLRPHGLLAGMRVRKKLLVLHTLFTVLLALALLLALRPAVRAIVRGAEMDASLMLLGEVALRIQSGAAGALPDGVVNASGATASTLVGSAEELGLSDAEAARAASAQGAPVEGRCDALGECAVVSLPGREARFAALSVRIPEARARATRLYIIAFGALLATYLIVAGVLELFVLPQSVYTPIRRVLDADDAVQRGDKKAEIIPSEDIPDDELGEVMRSRNESVLQLRRQEAALADALSAIETVATDLRRKNHLLETAQRNLADADRLAGLGMLSAGIAHELNTPLAVVKGLSEKIASEPSGGLDASEAQLMLRVVGRLERLSESLLDYARVRPPRVQDVALRPLVEEVLTLVRIDPDLRSVRYDVSVGEGVSVACDADRMVQVLLNIIRNAAEAARGARERGTKEAGTPEPCVAISAVPQERAGRAWVSVIISDNGPGIDAAILPRLFEPFASTRLDAKGTGLGLAVAEGIVREHGGVVLARNRTDASGAIFEVMVPRDAGAPVPAL